MQGERRSPQRGRNVEFADYRQYVRGDDPRQIDWNAYARLDRFFLKLFVEEEDASIHVLVDKSKSMAWGTPSKLAFGEQIAAMVAYVGLARLEWVHVGGYDTAMEARPQSRRGRAAAPQVFRLLERLQPSGQTDLARSVRRYLPAVRKPGPMVIVSDLYDAGWRDGVTAALAAGCDVSVVHVLSRDEVDPSLDGDLRLIDAETEDTVDVSIDESVLERYREALEGWQADAARWCTSHGVAYLRAVSDMSLSDAVNSMVRRGVVVPVRS
jgi:uncharacterized protein (DUF58 family)